MRRGGYVHVYTRGYTGRIANVERTHTQAHTRNEIATALYYSRTERDVGFGWVNSVKRAGLCMNVGLWRRWKIRCFRERCVH